MKDEIKEILNKLDYNEWEVDLYKVPITWSELYDIRDYITNLQEELKEEKRIEQESLNTINNLQEENEHLRTQLNTLENTVIEVNNECNRLFNHLTKKI